MRNDARENAFKLIFESLFHELDEKLSLENLSDLKEKDQEFFQQIMTNFSQNKDQMKDMIEKHLKNYTFDRIFKIDLAVVFLILTEILFCGTAKAVAINEGLEIAKKYSTQKSHKFVNGLVCAILNDYDK